MLSLRTLRGMFVSSLCMGVLLGVANRSQAQNDTSQYVEEAAKNLRPVIKTAVDDGYRMQKGLTLAGGWLDKGENWTKMLSLELSGGRSYRIVGAGDFDAKNVDMRITDRDGKELVADKGVQKTPVVNFTPPVGAQYRVEMRVFASNNNVPCVCLMSVMIKP